MTLLNRGPVMWRCTNGAPNYRTTWWVRGFARAHMTLHGLPIYPVIEFTPWHRGVLSSNEDLGQETHSFSLQISFWKWTVGFILGRTDNIKNL